MFVVGKQKEIVKFLWNWLQLWMMQWQMSSSSSLVELLDSPWTISRSDVKEIIMRGQFYKVSLSNWPLTDNKVTTILSIRIMKSFWRDRLVTPSLSWVYTSGFRMRLLHCVAIVYNLPWFCSIKISCKKLQCNVENSCRNRMCKCTLSKQIFWSATVLYENSYNFGWWCNSKGVLSKGHRAYVVNSKSICELLTLY